MAAFVYIVILAGPNGAGKTTVSKYVLTEVFEIDEFVNADRIAAGLSAFAPESVAFEAGRIMLKRIDALLEQNKSFAFETTLSSKSFVKLVLREAAGLSRRADLRCSAHRVACEASCEKARR